MRISKDGDVRKQEFIEVALRLFLERGYQNTSVDMILKTVGVSRGAFYYYFKKKEDILESITDQYATHLADAVKQVYEDESLGAVEKLRNGFAKIQEVREINRDLLIKLYRLIERDENLLFKRKFLDKSIELQKPAFVKVLEQGNRENVFDINFPDETVETILRFTDRCRVKITSLFFDREENPAYQAAVDDLITYVEETVEKLLGMKKGTSGITREYHKYLTLLAE